MSFYDGSSAVQVSVMPGVPMHIMPGQVPTSMDGFHHPEPEPSTGPNYHHSQHHSHHHSQHHLHQQAILRKRKADSQDAHNERLSKRLSLLNLEQSGSKLYVPVEQAPAPHLLSHATSVPPAASASASASASAAVDDSEMMQLDDTKHKVYIYNLDDELYSDADDGSDPDSEGRLLFLPDVERHLRANRIVPGVPGVPRPVVPNRDGELAGMQLVLYDDGVRSVSVPEERDSVRKAIIEARERHRRRQQDERDARAAANNPLLQTRPRTVTFATPVKVAPPAAAVPGPPFRHGESSRSVPMGSALGFDDDAMDID